MIKEQPSQEETRSRATCGWPPMRTAPAMMPMAMRRFRLAKFFHTASGRRGRALVIVSRRAAPLLRMIDLYQCANNSFD